MDLFILNIVDIRDCGEENRRLWISSLDLW